MHGHLGVLILLGLCFPIVLLTRRLGGSSLIAYIIVGALATNSGLIEADSENILILAEMGAALLLFSLGLEMDLPQMRKHMSRVLLGSIGQIGLTILAGMGMMMLLGEDSKTAFIIGCCLTLSSTLMVLRALDEKQLRNKEEGQTVLGLLLAQDFAIAPMLLAISILLPQQEAALNSWQMALSVGILLFVTIFLRRFLASHIFKRIRGAQVPELEVALAITFALGTATITEHLGLGPQLVHSVPALRLAETNTRMPLKPAHAPFKDLWLSYFSYQ